MIIEEPTADEVGIRSRRPGDLLATSYGIGTEIGSDLVPANATAKVFMMAQGMGLFLHDDQFNLDKAQIFANCVMAYLVYSGHHYTI
ncbi:MAG: hypothetical protein A3F17_06155 [Gammaproteobacteria bacterium RIFCSPHIGHO2_12_FULL_41_15]|nr:MAG: hypothetical protein A3F17_06155 [Gammaproteobacteria bacterium RIFCSPHIGHO2_12_FULL_41_15]